jgi:colanic acid/amylovoran biosynthesis glycosyltransferase
MKLAVIVTEFPKTTETFILRDLMAFLGAGVDLRVYHLAPWRKDQILHDFAAPLLNHVRHVPLFAPATLAAMARHPIIAARVGGQVVWHQGRDGKIAAKSCALLAASIRLGEELRHWGADHIHAEFAGHPATAAWIAHQVSDIPFSISCRAHDIFRSQRLLAQKFAAASAVRSVSNYARRFLAEKVAGIREEHVDVIHSSVDVHAIPAEPRIPGQPFQILYVGSLQQRKGVDVLLNALSEFERQNWVLNIVGDGPDREKLQALCKILKLGPQVRFLGQMKFDEVTKLYQRASVCVAPSIIGPNGRTEGIPNVMIEALAYLRPAISTNVSGIPELIRPGETGWLTEPGDVSGLARALRDVYDNPDKAALLAKQGRALVEREFDLRINALRQIRIFGLGAIGETELSPSEVT